jgi:hypothetical protein
LIYGSQTQFIFFLAMIFRKSVSSSLPASLSPSAQEKKKMHGGIPAIRFEFQNHRRWVLMAIMGVLGWQRGSANSATVGAAFSFNCNASV